MTSFHFYASADDDGEVVAFGTANELMTDRMLEACGFKWNRRRQRYIGTPTRLIGMNKLIDAGFVPASDYSAEPRFGLWREGMTQCEVLAYGEAVKMLKRDLPVRCRHTLEMFA